MAVKLARHGTEAGYKSELKTGHPCQRCITAHRVYNKQFTKTGKAKGLKYSSHDVLTDEGPTRGQVGRSRGGSVGTPAPAPDSYQGETGRDATGQGDPATAGAGTDRLRALGDRLASLAMPKESGEYVGEEPPDYLHPSDADPEPSDTNWGDVPQEEFVINAAGMAKIEENLGTYLSIVGMTAEMIDPYCGSVLAVNFDNIVNKWSKVVAHYPAAAKLFLDSKGGVIFTWIAALQATWPVLYAMYEHHLARTVTVKDGAFFRRRTTGQPMPDATMPPMRDDYEYAAT
jgi:hypothetical protein